MPRAKRRKRTIEQPEQSEVIHSKAIDQVKWKGADFNLPSNGGEVHLRGGDPFKNIVGKFEMNRIKTKEDTAHLSNHVSYMTQRGLVVQMAENFLRMFWMPSSLSMNIWAKISSWSDMSEVLGRTKWSSNERTFNFLISDDPTPSYEVHHHSNFLRDTSE